MPYAQEIIDCARTYLGTPFHHQGRLKGVGVDCIGLVVGVADSLGLTDDKGIPLASFDHADYPPTPAGESLKRPVSLHLYELPSAGEYQPADVLLFRFHQDPQHVGIVSRLPDGELGIIHCYASIGKVVEHRLNDTWKRLIVAAFRFPQLLTDST